MIDTVLTYAGSAIMILGIISVIVGFTIDGVNWVKDNWRASHGS